MQAVLSQHITQGPVVFQRIKVIPALDCWCEALAYNDVIECKVKIIGMRWLIDPYFPQGVHLLGLPHYKDIPLEMYSSLEVNVFLPLR